MSDHAGFGPDHYLPVLRWKAGEIRAFKKLLAWKQAAHVTPVFVIDNPAERQQNERETRIPTEPVAYIDYVQGEMQKVLRGHRCFVDTVLFDKVRTGVDGLSRFFETLMALAGDFVPVLRLDDSEARLDGMKATVGTKGAALRVGVSSTGECGAVDAFLKKLSLDETSIDLIVDLGEVRDAVDVPSVVDDVAVVLGREKPWRSFTLLAGSFPRKLDGGAKSPTRYPRYDRAAYEAVRPEIVRRRLRTPSYGDYGIVWPQAEPTSGTLSGGGSWPVIRYCAADAWYVWKSAEGAEAGKTSPYFALARDCATQKFFMGPGFAFGDEYIDDRASGSAPTGGQSVVYVTVDTNHHLAFASAQHRNALPLPNPRSADQVFPPGADLGFDQDDGADDDYWDI